jgi:hypothetical protein
MPITESTHSVLHLLLDVWPAAHRRPHLGGGRYALPRLPVGGTAGRTTLAGEGLQHQDGHSHLLAYPVPNLLAYDPAFAYEIAVIIQDGIKRMYVEQEHLLLHHGDERAVAHAGDAAGGHVREGILKGLYRFRASEKKDGKAKAQLLGSGAILLRSVEGRADSGGEIRRRRRRLERHQLQGALPRWQRLRALEHAASGLAPAQPYVARTAERRARRVGGGFRLYEGAAGIDLASGCRAR